MKKILMAAALTAGFLAANGGSVYQNYFIEPEHISALENAEDSDEKSADELIEKLLSETGFRMTNNDFDSFEEKYGSVSIHGKYIVYCNIGNCMINSFSEQSGTGKLDDGESFFTDEAVPTGGNYRIMRIYKAAAPGEMRFDIKVKNMSNLVVRYVYSADLKINDDLSITALTDNRCNSTSDSDQQNSADDGDISGLVIGDVNSSGTIDISDLTEVSLFLIRDKTFTEMQLRAADVDNYGKVELADLARIRQYISRNIPML